MNNTQHPAIVIVGLSTIRELLKGNNVNNGNAILIPDSNVLNESKIECTLVNSEFIPINIGPIPTQLFQIHEMEDLVGLISWVAHGSEQGVMTYDQWKEKAHKLRDLLVAKGYKPHGFWTV
jgi:hypothetical protein